MMRRGFLKLFGAAATLGSVGGIQGGASQAGFTPPVDYYPSQASNPSSPGLSPKFLEFAKNKVFPEWYEKIAWDQAKSQSLNWLDPDIENKKSWSMSVKRLTQAERNFQRLLQSNLDDHFIGLERQKFMQKWGFWL